MLRNSLLFCICLCLIFCSSPSNARHIKIGPINIPLPDPPKPPEPPKPLEKVIDKAGEVIHDTAREAGKAPDAAGEIIHDTAKEVGKAPDAAGEIIHDTVREVGKAPEVIIYTIAEDAPKVVREIGKGLKRLWAEIRRSGENASGVVFLDDDSEIAYGWDLCLKGNLLSFRPIVENIPLKDLCYIDLSEYRIKVNKGTEILAPTGGLRPTYNIPYWKLAKSNPPNRKTVAWGLALESNILKIKNQHPPTEDSIDLSKVSISIVLKPANGSSSFEISAWD